MTPAEAMAADRPIVPAAQGAGAERIRIEQHGFAGMLWFVGWLFTIGFLDLSFWKGLLALIVWPYYMGTWFAVTI